MTKNEIIKAIKVIARMNQFIANAENLFGKAEDSIELTWIVSGMVETLIDAVGVKDSDIVFDTLFSILPKGNMERVYNTLIENLDIEKDGF